MKLSKKLNKALELFNSGKLADARQIILKITSVDGHNVDAWQLLGMTEARLGKFEDAAICFRKILSLLPGSIDAHYYLGAALEGQKLYSNAIREYEITLDKQPANIKALYNLGNIYNAKGLFGKAEEYYRKVLHHNPQHVEALNNLGSNLKALLRLEEALECFQKALVIKPGDPGLLLNLGNTCHQLEDFNQAEKYYRDAISIGGGLSEAYSGLCGVLCKQGKVPEAQQLLKDARRVLPDDDGIVASQATILEEGGQYEEAYDALKERLGSNCYNVDIAVSFAKVAPYVGLEHEAIELLEKLLKVDQSVPDRMNIRFMLGGLYDDLHQYDKAYNHYYAANKLEPCRLERNELVKKFDKLISIFTKDLLSTIEHSGFNTDKPVFVVGMPRSGTSLVEQILASHPDVFGAGELIDVGKIVASIKINAGGDKVYPACIPSIGSERLAELASQYKSKIDELAPDAVRVIDKMPGNFPHLGFIELMFPNARIIHCMRNPLDNCLSCYSMKFLGYHPYAYNQADLGFYYCQYLRLMKHWKEVIGLPVYTVQYESLVNNQKEISREMIEFCGLAWDERCLDFHKTKRLVKTASYDQVRRPMYSNAIGRSDPYREKLGALIKELGKCHQ